MYMHVIFCDTVYRSACGGFSGGYYPGGTARAAEMVVGWGWGLRITFSVSFCVFPFSLILKQIMKLVILTIVTLSSYSVSF